MLKFRDDSAEVKNIDLDAPAASDEPKATFSLGKVKEEFAADLERMSQNTLSKDALKERNKAPSKSRFDALPEEEQQGYEAKYPWSEKNEGSFAKYNKLISKVHFDGKEARIATLDNEKDKDLIRRVAYFSDKMGIEKTPPIWIVDTHVINAASMPTGSIVFTTEIMNHMAPGELDAVIGHELTHHKERISSTALGLGSYLLVSEGLRRLPLPGVDFGKGKVAKGTAILAGAGVFAVDHMISIIPHSYLRYQNEYKADIGGAQFAGAENMADALVTLEKTKLGKQERYVDKMADEHFKAKEDKHKPSFLGKALRFVLSPYPDHPATDLRVERLRAAAKSEAPSQKVAPTEVDYHNKIAEMKAEKSY